MDAALKLHQRKHVGSRQGEGCLPDAAEIAVGLVEHFGAPAFFFSEFEVHPEHFRREQSGLLAARRRTDFDDGVAGVRGIARDEGDGELLFDFLRFAFELCKIGLQKCEEVRVGFVLKQFAVFTDLVKCPVPEVKRAEDSGETLPFPGEGFAFRRL